MLVGELISTNGIMISSRAEGWTSKKSPVKVTGKEFYCPEVEWNLKIQNCSQTRNPKVFPLGKTGNCGFQVKRVPWDLSSLSVWVKQRQTADYGLCDTCHFSSTTDGQTASLPTLSFSSQPDRRWVGFNTELPGLWVTKVYDLNGRSLWKQTPKHQHILGEGIQPLGVTGSQDLSSTLRLLWVASHLGKTGKCPLSGLPALQSLLEVG